MGNLQLFIRHPEQVAIEVQPATTDGATANRSSDGLGLICSSTTAYAPGTPLSVNFPELPQPIDSVHGTVFNCFQTGEHFELAIQFRSPEHAMRLRMAEQQTYIELYRQHLLQDQGRTLSLDEAALEWIERYAASFPDNTR